MTCVIKISTTTNSLARDVLPSPLRMDAVRVGIACQSAFRSPIARVLARMQRWRIAQAMRHHTPHGVTQGIPVSSCSNQYGTQLASVLASGSASGLASAFASALPELLTPENSPPKGKFLRAKSRFAFGAGDNKATTNRNDSGLGSGIKKPRRTKPVGAGRWHKCANCRVSLNGDESPFKRRKQVIAFKICQGWLPGDARLTRALVDYDWRMEGTRQRFQSHWVL